ncbi:Glucose/arabinose dehydrogenase, beta-propeller fold [Bradyrhizobium lablabi]|jgi:glucose/arabinose dehydrogenase|uniref:Glucose/arabinose dehydrogenase, beta-propeller fold n=3 Tax=Nitrobacteraceae TaxID=41294 RepID=A0ABY0PPQ5_9BRAD|nr:Glucose/arabinose dehydrogenase, beta-propeller fold [Bradyrhizobium ottawaense]SED24033.1 Glucose/arabinose dehydrogenase, beta-propeller fold [Bradyrhizobium lablabi]
MQSMHRWICASAILFAGFGDASAQTGPLTGEAAFGDWRSDKPGVVRLIRPGDLPKPGATASASNSSRVVPRPSSAAPQVPAGFKIELFAEGLSGPRQMRVAPNGDIFVAETSAGRVRVLRPAKHGSKPAVSKIFANKLDEPFGIAFFPGGENPKWVYVANTNSVVRFPYASGDTKAAGKPETVIASLPEGGHTTRDVVFSKDDRQMMVSVGSLSNVGEGMGSAPGGLPSWIAQQALGASWGDEAGRAGVLTFDPDGKNAGVFATGIRNCVGLAVHPSTGDLYCSTNERDGLGDNLVPDYVTRVRRGAFYGWPWFYIGENQDPRHPGERADLKGKITIPDVLIQSHSASLGLTFYNGSAFPAEYSGDGFAAEHGSWNRSKRTGYKVIRIRLKDGTPTGEYEDFVTGFVVNASEVWGRPVGVAVARDGALLVSEDGNGTIWRITHP